MGDLKNEAEFVGAKLLNRLHSSWECLFTIPYGIPFITTFLKITLKGI